MSRMFFICLSHRLRVAFHLDLRKFLHLLLLLPLLFSHFLLVLLLFFVSSVFFRFDSIPCLRLQLFLWFFQWSLGIFFRAQASSSPVILSVWSRLSCFAFSSLSFFWSSGGHLSLEWWSRMLPWHICGHCPCGSWRWLRHLCCISSDPSGMWCSRFASHFSFGDR